MNLVDAQAQPAQSALLDIVREHPEKTLREASKLRHLKMPGHHAVHPEDVNLKRLGAVLAVAYERDLHNFAELLLLEKLGPRTLQSLALVADVVHGAPSRFSDPARFSFAHGGKDRHPFPVPLKTYDESINFLRSSLDAARVGDKEKLEGFRRLERFTRAVEIRREPEADFDAVIVYENAISTSLDGRSVFDDNPAGPGKQDSGLRTQELDSEGSRTSEGGVSKIIPGSARFSESRTQESAIRS